MLLWSSIDVVYIPNDQERLPQTTQANEEMCAIFN